MDKKTFTKQQRETGRQRKALERKKQQLQQKLAALSRTESDLKRELAMGASRRENRIASLTERQSRFSQEVAGLRSEINEAAGNLSERIGELLFSLDPRDQVALLDDAYPVFLMPVRVEGRFMTIKHIARVSREKSQPGASSRISIRDGRPVFEPGSFSVSDLFEGRSELPVIEDTRELWIRIFPDDIAVHTHEQALTETEIKAAQTFWTLIWRAGDNADRRIGAWRGLRGGRGPERAAWIAKQMTPVNETDKPAAELGPEDPLPAEPQFPSPALKDGSWSTAPHSKVLPDRFIVRLYSGNSFREVVGQPVPESLQLGLDPQAPDPEISATAGNLEMGDKIKWLQDFEEAEKNGMGIRVPLINLEAFTGFDKVLVLGVKSSANQEEGQALLEELLDNHHYTPGGLGLVPQGTPTNNTEDVKTGYTARNRDEDDLFAIEMGDPRFTPVAEDPDKPDGQHLAEALGISFEKVQHLIYADQTDIHEAMCMNRALWPATLGYFLAQMMFPIFSEEDMARTREHFFRHVLGRGRIPAIRVDDQPYGILPATAFSKWKYAGKDKHSLFLGRLFGNILRNMETSWDSLAQQVKHAGSTVPGNQLDDRFLNIMGLHASSVEFYQRFVMGPYFLWNLYNYSGFIQKIIFQPGPVSYASSLNFLQLFLDRNFLFTYPPRVFDFFYAREHKFLDGPLIDSLKLSETRRIEALGSAGENYIDWLIQSNWNQIKAEDFSNIGAGGATPPNALLYLMLRHAALIEYDRAGFHTLKKNGILQDLDYLDLEMSRIQTSAAINPEMEGMVKARIAFKESLKVEHKLQEKVQEEFENRLASGSLAGMTLKKLEAEKQAFRSELLAGESEKLEKRVNKAFKKAIADQRLSLGNRNSLDETYAFLQNETLAEFLDRQLLEPEAEPELFGMKELVAAFQCLKDIPTARLERCFAEHIDLASYRLDAWFYSLVTDRLLQQRGSGESRKKGLFLGAYAWLENLRPGSLPGIHYREVDIEPDRILVPGFSEVTLKEGLTLEGRITTIEPWLVSGVRLGDVVPRPGAPASRAADPLEGGKFLLASGGQNLSISAKLNSLLVDEPLIMDVSGLLELGPRYTYLGTASVGDITYDPVTDKFIHKPRVDPANQGYIHAPSINQATAAAVLRAGYETHHANPSSPENALAVNLSSDRVRRAMFYLEGMRNGQELAALLGYQFERGLHDRDIGLDQFILEFRLKYPLVAGRVTDSSGATSIEEAESYNVIHGLELLENSRDPLVDYPYGVTGLPGSGAAKTAIIEEVESLHDAMDGINDLLMSEAMYQVVQGNIPRANAALNAMSGQGVLAEADIVRTPRTYHALSNRLAIPFDLAAGGHRMWTPQGTPRSLAEPNLNRWLAGILPDPALIRVNYSYRFVSFDGRPGSPYDESLILEDLGLEPIDLFHLLIQPAEQGDSVELVDRIGFHIRRNVLAADNLSIAITFADRTGFGNQEISLLELQALIDPLSEVLGNCRPLAARDFLLATGAEDVIATDPGKGLDTTALLNRLNDVAGVTMSNGARGMAGVLSELAGQIVNLKALVSAGSLVLGGDDYLGPMRDALLESALFGAQNAVPPSGIESSEEILEELLDLAGRVQAEMQPRLDQANALLAQAAAAPAQEQKASLLAQAAQNLFGRAYRVFPEYRLYNESQVQAAYQFEHLLDFAGPMAVEEWIQGLAPVRKRIRTYQQAALISEALRMDLDPAGHDLMQLPLEPLDPGGDPATRWLGMAFPEDYDMPDDNLSIVLRSFPGYAPSGLQAGILVDEWVEEIPDKTAHTGVAVHYNNPDSEPPQSCLLAVTPDITGKWSWDDLMDTLSETLEWAKKRAVDPDLLAKTHYAQVLPATFAAVSASEDIPTLDFGRNIIPKPKPGKFGLVNILDYEIPKLTFFDPD